MKTTQFLLVTTCALFISIAAWARGGDKGSDPGKEPTPVELTIHNLRYALMMNHFSAFTEILEGDALELYGNNLEAISALQKTGFGLLRARVEISSAPNGAGSEDWTAEIAITPTSYQESSHSKKFALTLRCPKQRTTECKVRKLATLSD